MYIDVQRFQHPSRISVYFHGYPCISRYTWISIEIHRNSRGMYISRNVHRCTAIPTSFENFCVFSWISMRIARRNTCWNRCTSMYISRDSLYIFMFFHLYLPHRFLLESNASSTKNFLEHLEQGGCRTRPQVSIPAHSNLVFWN